MQYSPNDLPIEKSAKTSVSKTSVSKVHASSSHGTLGNDSDLTGQMIDSPYPRGRKSQVSPASDVITADSTIEDARATLAVSGIEPDLTGELTFSEEIQK